MSEYPLRRYGAVLGICVLAGALAGGLAGFGSASAAQASVWTATVIAGGTAVAMAIGLWACMRWWQGLDEAAQEAHKWAWWWGSTFGMALGGVALFTLTMGFGDTLSGQPRDMLLVGAALLAGSQTIGYAIAWTVWWLKRR